VSSSDRRTNLDVSMGGADLAGALGAYAGEGNGKLLPYAPPRALTGGMDVSTGIAYPP